MTSKQIPQAMTAWIKDSGIGRVEFLLVVNLLLAGNVMEPSSIVLITARILFPIAVSLGINPVHLDILMTVTMEVASAIRRTASISTSPPALPAAKWSRRRRRPPALQLNSIETCVPGRPSAPKQPGGSTRLGFAKFFGG
jgi:hypothetical protein